MSGRDTPPAPLKRGDLGYSFEKLVAAKSEVLSVRLQVVALGLGGSAWASHTPAPLERGVSGYNFEELVAARRYLSGFRRLLWV